MSFFVPQINKLQPPPLPIQFQNHYLMSSASILTSDFLKPTIKKIPRRKLKIIKKQRSPYIIGNKFTGHWTQKQRNKYYIFLKIHHDKFERKHLRRAQKVFKAMSYFLESRTPEQCRSHHQKMEKKCLNFQNILQFLAQNYSQHTDNSTLVLECLNIKIDCEQHPELRLNQLNFQYQTVKKIYDIPQYFEMPKLLEPEFNKINTIRSKIEIEYTETQTQQLQLKTD